MVEESRSWDYRRIQVALSNLEHKIGPQHDCRHSAAARHRAGTRTEPRDHMEGEFLTQKWELIVAADFLTVEMWTRRGLQRFVVLFFIELPTRKVAIADTASVVNGLWMHQIGRNLTDAVDGILRGKRYLMHNLETHCSPRGF